MGQHLSLSILTEVRITKKGLDADNFSELNEDLSARGLDLSIYEGELGEGYWEGKLQSSVLQKELLPFLKSTYALLEKHTRLDDSEAVMAALEQRKPEEWPEMMENADYYNFQVCGYPDLIYLRTPVGEVKLSFYAIMLKTSEKIFLESDAGLFNLFSESLQLHLQEFQLSKSLRIHLTG